MPSLVVLFQAQKASSFLNHIKVQHFMSLMKL